MPDPTPGPSPRSPRRDDPDADYVDEHGVWVGAAEHHEVCTDDVIAALPDAGPLVPMSRRAAEDGVTSAIVRATWKARTEGSDREVRGSLAAVLEFRPGREQR